MTQICSARHCAAEEITILELLYFSFFSSDQYLAESSVRAREQEISYRKTVTTLTNERRLANGVTVGRFNNAAAATTHAYLIHPFVVENE